MTEELKPPRWQYISHGVEGLVAENGEILRQVRKGGDVWKFKDREFVDLPYAKAAAESDLLEEQSPPLRPIAAQLSESEIKRLAVQCEMQGMLTEFPKYKAFAHAIAARIADENARDAARYRWLRDIGDKTWTPLRKRMGSCAIESDADAAIDAAMAQGEKV